MTRIAPDPYAKQRGRLRWTDERAIIALGDYDKPLHETHIKTIVGMRAHLVRLEDKGYAFTPTMGKLVDTWMLTNSGIEQYRRLKGVKA